jgi:hypothetical protein
MELKLLTWVNYRIDEKELALARLNIELSKTSFSIPVKKENIGKMIKLIEGVPRSFLFL